MRIVHTSDWHAGRRWKGVDRLPELQAVLSGLAEFVEKEKVDLVLVTGDLFDTGSPPPEAERVVFDLFLRLGRSGAKTILIGGNHDNPDRLEAWGRLAALVDVTVVARPKTAARGGLLTIETRSGERALVGAIPFASPGRLVSAMDFITDETAARQRYDEAFKALVANVAAPFAGDLSAVHLLMLHTHLAGALFSGSERTVHLGEEWAATPQSLPATAHYVALGHIHKPQQVQGTSAPAFYAGSPLQLDFGEVGEEKSFRFIEARAGRPATHRAVPYQGGQPLRDVRASLADLERDREKLSTAGWLRITVPLEAPDPDLSPKVKRLLPNALLVRPELPERVLAPEVSVEASSEKRDGRAARDLYAAYVEREQGRTPEKRVLVAFDALRDELLEDDAGALGIST